MRVLTPHEVSLLVGKGLVDGIGKLRRDAGSGEKVPVLTGLRLVGSRQAVYVALKRVARQSVRVSAIGSRTWVQDGPTTFSPHMRRCEGYVCV